MSMAIIYKDSTEHIRPNFVEKEFFTKDPDFHIPYHQIDNRVLNAFQIVRDWYEIPVEVTSTFRNESYNKAIGGSPKSQHIRAKAADGKFLGARAAETLEKMRSDIGKRGPLYNKLRQAGISGFGLYDTFFHLDARDTEGDAYNDSDQYGRLSTWNLSKKKT